MAYPFVFAGYVGLAVAEFAVRRGIGAVTPFTDGQLVAVIAFLCAILAIIVH